ncbi:cation:proton antiporter regulatory subunit [Haloarchaeobius sp. HME9146]|uniref:cation:proton antiporter regulatory subunit n=1 Tax=Haloarchaeobius sp. HME9146 TaxID=2978732 RepID=UPI0021C05927|nr:TrkA C-terminal domain-containing protein [Haloarchaeobius sp. HME9146]MCT9097456.1 potassium transporter TrkA [Haloarchaeobius sp. HME9146]
MTVYETDVPGVGRKFEVELDGGGRLVVLIHHDGRREMFHRTDPEADSTRIASLSGEQARQLGAILGGAYFQPVELQQPQVPLGDAIIEWVTVDEGSTLEGQTLESCGVRTATGASIMAIQRNDETVANPDPTFELRGGDILVAIGTREEQEKLRSFVHKD